MQSRILRFFLLVYCAALVPAAANAASAAAQAGGVATGLLWRVTSPQGAQSHLFGTLHSSDSRVTNLARPVQRAFDGSERVLLETDFDSAKVLASAQLMMYPAGESLRENIPDHLYQQVLALGSDKGLPESVVNRLRPWAVGVAIATPATKQGEFLDKKLATMARAAGKPLIGLETVEEQLSTFTALSPADQLELLSGIVEEFDQLPEHYANLERAYLDRDLKRILELAMLDLDAGDARLAGILLTGLVDDRNRRMADRADVVLSAGGSFMAVGALHLPGPAGLIALLRRRGYRVAVLW